MRRFDVPGRSPVFAPNAAATTSHPLATATALKILHDGGNAVDAAIAASATLCVVEPHSTGIGGDCFAIVAEPDGKLHGLNGSGRSPAGLKAEWLIEHGFSAIPEYSVHSVTAPGAVRAWETLHRRFGRIDFARLFADAVTYARDGYPVAPRIAHDWARYRDRLAADPGAKLHCLKDGRTPVAGETMRAPALGGVLARIAREGASAFYEGEVAADIAAAVAAKGGFLTEADLAVVDSSWIDPIRTDYRGYEICELPPNGQGLTALVLFNLLRLVDPPPGHDSAQRLHQLLELGRNAYAVRDAEIADPVTMHTATQRLLSDEYARQLLANYRPDRRDPEITLPKLPNADTVYLAVVDRDRLAVSFINSLYHGFGSGIVGENTGIALQNRGACFVVEPGHPNCIAPSKRPMHTIIPGMVLNGGRASYVLGVMGSAYQPMGHAHVLSNLLDYGMDVQEAIDSARIFWADDGALEAESGVPDDTLEGLRQRGWQVRRGGLWGGGQMIAIDWETGTLCAGSDPRKDGHAAGY